jgi:hypothetical protein
MHSRRFNAPIPWQDVVIADQRKLGRDVEQTTTQEICPGA